MASWRDNLLTASFRGAKFRVSSHTGSIGRRNVISQFPYRDSTRVEDLGLDADEYSIEAYVISNSNNADKDFYNGGDYFGQRNALINALKKKGPGTLIHPYLGTIRVVVSGKVSFSENIGEGGICKFSIKFVVAGKEDYPDLKTDVVGATDKQAIAASEASTDHFGETVETDDIPSWSLTSFYNDFIKFTNIGNAYISRIRNSGGNPLRDFKNSIDSARSLVTDALQVPCQMAGLALDVFDSVLAMVNVLGPGYAVQVLGECTGRLIREINSTNGDVIDNAIGISMIDNLTDLAGDSDSNGYGSPDQDIANSSFEEINVTTPDSARQSANRLELINFIKLQAIATATRVAIRVAYQTLDEANLKLNKILDCIDYLLLKFGDESASDPYSPYGIYTDNRDVYNELQELRSVFVESMREKTLGLASDSEYECPPDAITSLEVAYDLYEDIDRADEIYVRNIDLNNHPAFMSGTINVLSE